MTTFAAAFDPTFSPTVDASLLDPGVPTYDAAATALFARFTTPPTGARKRAINTFITALKTAGVWTKLDALYVVAAADSQAATRNWVADQYNLTVNGTPTFTVDRGYTGNGTNGYLGTGAVPSALTKYLQDNAHHSVFVRGAPGAGLLGRVTGSVPNLLQTNAGLVQTRINGAAGISIAYTPATNLYFLTTRADATAVTVYANGASLGPITAASAARDAEAIALLRAGSSFATSQISTATIGGLLSAGEGAALYAAKLAYLTAVGAV